MLQHVLGLVNEDHSMFAFELSTVLAGYRHRDTKAHLSRRYSYEPGAVMHATLHHGGLLKPGRDRPLELSAADRAALISVCEERLRP